MSNALEKSIMAWSNWSQSHTPPARSSMNYSSCVSQDLMCQKPCWRLLSRPLPSRYSIIDLAIMCSHILLQIAVSETGRKWGWLKPPSTGMGLPLVLIEVWKTLARGMLRTCASSLNTLCEIMSGPLALSGSFIPLSRFSTSLGSTVISGARWMFAGSLVGMFDLSSSV